MNIDKALIAQLIQKDHEAYNTFYLQTVDMFYRFVISRYVLSSADIEDVISDFYVKFRRVVDRYNDEYSFETYMWTVFRNTLKDRFKKNTPIQLAHDFDVPDLDIDETTLLSGLEQDYLMEDIQEAMASLDEISYGIIFMKFIEEKSYQEIAILLDMSEDAVRQRISRSLKKLKVLLGEDIKN